MNEIANELFRNPVTVTASGLAGVALDALVRGTSLGEVQGNTVYSRI